MSTPIIDCPKFCVENADGNAWLVRYVPFNGCYGANMRLVNDGPPMVEFYDRDYAFEFETQEEVPKSERTTEHPKFLGQFVSRYQLRTMLQRTGGLILNGGVHKWQLDAQAMKHVVDWLRQFQSPQPPVVDYDVWGNTAREQVLVYDNEADEPAVIVRFDTSRNVQEVAVRGDIQVVDPSRTTTHWEVERDRPNGTPMGDQSSVPSGNLDGYWVVTIDGDNQAVRVVGNDVYLCGRAVPMQLEDVDKWLLQVSASSIHPITQPL